MANIQRIQNEKYQPGEIFKFSRCGIIKEDVDHEQSDYQYST